VAFSSLERSPVAFGYVRERGERLRALGALHVDNDGVVRTFCDKPTQSLDRFNGFWGCFAFRRTAAIPLLDMMTRSIRRDSVDICAELGRDAATAFPLAAYQDLGTWTSLREAYLTSLPIPHRHSHAE
jgi:hypothetical protein